MPGTGAIVGIAVGSAIAGIVILTFLTHFLRMWLRGPSSGTDNRKRLDGKVVAITGKRNLSSNHRSRWSIYRKVMGVGSDTFCDPYIQDFYDFKHKKLTLKVRFWHFLTRLKVN